MPVYAGRIVGIRAFTRPTSYSAACYAKAHSPRGLLPRRRAGKLIGLGCNKVEFYVIQMIDGSFDRRISFH